MTSHAHLALALACAAFAFATPAHAQGQCDSAQIGNVTGEVYTNVERRVLPDTFTLEISEPDMCPESVPVGLEVTACDADESPRVYLLDATRGVVVREGALRTEAYVYMTMFCSDSGQAAYDYSEPINLSSRSSPSLSTSWIGSPSGVATPSPQPLLTSPSDTPQTSSVEATSTTSSVTESPQPDTESENQPIPIQLESRFSSVSKDSLTGRPGLVNLPSKLKEALSEQPKRPPIPTPEELFSLWKQRKPSLEKLKRPFESKRLHDNETLTSPVLGQPGMFDSYSSLLNKILSSYSKDPMSPWSQRPSSSWTDPALPSLAKRFPELRPENTSPLLLNRSPAWLKRPTKRPSTTWLRQGSLPDWSTRKSLSRPHKHLGGHSVDDGEQWWSPYDNGALLLQPEEILDTFPRWTENKPSPSSIQHITKKHHRYVPPIYEEDQTADWKDQLSKRSALPKLLLLLQEQEQPTPAPPAMKMKICESTHSVEDGEPWWPNAISEHSEDANLWQPDYPADYTADDGDPFSRSENIRPPPHGLPHYKEQSGSAPPQWLDHPRVPEALPPFVTESPVHSCIKCAPVNAIEERKLIWQRHSRVSKEPQSQPQMYRRPPLEHNRFGHNHPKAHTELPMLASTPGHAAWPSPALSESMLSSLEQGDHPASAAHWSYLSKLLLSHPAFRDSTHVIRI